MDMINDLFLSAQPFLIALCFILVISIFIGIITIIKSRNVVYAGAVSSFVFLLLEVANLVLARLFSEKIFYQTSIMSIFDATAPSLLVVSVIHAVLLYRNHDYKLNIFKTIEWFTIILAIINIFNLLKLFS